MPATCPHCQKHFPKSKTINSRHKSVCGGWGETSKPSACLCGHESTSTTQMKRHRQKCDDWKSRDRGEVQGQRLKNTLQDRYGVSTVMAIPEAEAKRKATLKARYGAENVKADPEGVAIRVVEFAFMGTAGHDLRSPQSVGVAK